MMTVGWRMGRRQTPIHYPYSPVVRWPVGTPVTVPSVGSVKQGKLPVLMRRVVGAFRLWHRNVARVTSCSG